MDRGNIFTTPWILRAYSYTSQNQNRNLMKDSLKVSRDFQNMVLGMLAVVMQKPQLVARYKQSIDWQSNKIRGVEQSPTYLQEGTSQGSLISFFEALTKEK